MKTSMILALATGLCVYGLVLEGRQSNWTVGQTVDTDSGPVTGHAAENNTQVSEYLGIPYGQAPIGDLRFAAPLKYTGNSPINATSFGPSCPVRQSSTSATTAQDLDAANLTSASVSTLAILSNTGANYSEDCLYLNVWTKPQTGDAKKAVLVWLYGGGFSSGSSSVPGYNGENLAGQEDVVVVSLNYRLSILGFPGGSATANVALLDQRLAVEWVRDNIAAFGGDPSRITLFGQSAGAAAIDMYSYAWTEDPIAAGFIPESGNAIGWGLPNSKNFTAAAWYNVSSTLGCGNASSDPATVLSCMRLQNSTTLLDAIPAATGTASILGYFGPTEDDKIVFSNYPSRTPAKVPMLIGSNNYEAGLFRTEFGLAGVFYSDAFWDTFNLQSFTCPTGIRANLSVAAGNPTWRYRYFGVFPNLAISDDAGAWHTAEVPMLFNTAPNSIPATAAQVSIGNYMRGAWAAFAKDPSNGLTNYGWPRYDTSQDSLVRLAYDNVTGPNLINPYRYDADCVLVNVSSIDSSVATPELPDLGAGVTPTAVGNSATSGTFSAPTATTTGNAGAKMEASAWVGLMVVVLAGLL
ncbi:carboxylesterase [Diplocarpon rosae]|nr:carboxylesterase [Diplocarpon rosae]